MASKAKGPGRPKPKGPARPRGRPPGSVSLTPEIQNTIVSLVRAGAFAEGAAQLAGIDPRTFRDWMARGEGRHRTKTCTPKLREFAKAVRIAKSEARAAREIEVARRDPRYWLSRAARSAPNQEGWTDNVYPEIGTVESSPPPFELSNATMAETLEILREVGMFSAADCPAEHCQCICHGRNHEHKSS